VDGVPVDGAVGCGAAGTLPTRVGTSGFLAWAAPRPVRVRGSSTVILVLMWPILVDAAAGPPTVLTPGATYVAAGLPLPAPELAGDAAVAAPAPAAVAALAFAPALPDALAALKGAFLMSEAMFGERDGTPT
jgi:hypothetical protein